MYRLFNGKRTKYIFLLPIIVLIISSVYFLQLSKESQNALLQEKYVSLQEQIEILSIAVETNEGMCLEDDEKNIKSFIRYIDGLYMTYAAAYKHTEKGFELITDRNYLIEFNPFKYPEFNKAIDENYYGELILPIAETKDNDLHNMYVYFKYIPSEHTKEEQYLIIGGVSKHSIVNKIPFKISVGNWLSILITFGLNVWLVLVLSRLGHVYRQRKGDKWRDSVDR